MIAAVSNPGELGISEVLSNEFLDTPDYFPEETNYPISMYILEDGSFGGRTMDLDESGLVES